MSENCCRFQRLTWVNLDFCDTVWQILNIERSWTLKPTSDCKCHPLYHSHYRPGQAMRVAGGSGSQISRQSAHEGGKVVSHTHRPLLPIRKYSWYSFLLEAESTPRDIVRPEELCQWKIPRTPSRIEPATFRLVAQCFNQLRHRVPQSETCSLYSWLRI